MRALTSNLPEHLEGILRAVGGVRTGRSVAGAHLPGRAMSSDGVLLILGDVIVGHAGEEIVRVVVLAHVLQAKPPVFVLPQPALGRAVRGVTLAAFPVADRRIRGALAPVVAGLDADAVEERRVEFHDRSLWGVQGLTFKS